MKQIINRLTIRPRTNPLVKFVISLVPVCFAATDNTANSGVWSNNATWGFHSPGSWRNHTGNLNISSTTLIS